MCCIAYVLNKLGDDSAIPGAAGDDAPRSSHREDAEDPSYNSPTSSSREGHSEEPLLEPSASPVASRFMKPGRLHEMDGNRASPPAGDVSRCLGGGASCQWG
ncbi:TPA: hypothetical protein ACH3X3_000471 [Trebouxia sp. C0006]